MNAFGHVRLLIERSRQRAGEL